MIGCLRIRVRKQPIIALILQKDDTERIWLHENLEKYLDREMGHIKHCLKMIVDIEYDKRKT